ncbi:MAG TPA: lipopolysaccharide heptosyltransferase I [Gammaproteobacteria bacterium]|nr:lipopolysaccharide heptosyltransferase I [Gammaproteobacteria bacterium]
MRVLVVKTSSMGDLVHTLPALTDATNACGDIKFDWVCEPAFSDIPRWHPSVGDVLAIPLRRWKGQLHRLLFSHDLAAFKQVLGAERYDAVIDAQGLLKSAFLIARFTDGPKHGFDRRSAKEGMAASVYNVKHRVARSRHAILRTRELFAKSLGYSVPDTAPDASIDLGRPQALADRLVLVTQTSRQSKCWISDRWRAVIEDATPQFSEIILPVGSEMDYELVSDMTDGLPVRILNQASLDDVAFEISGARAVVSVDTGLAHVADALGIETLALFGPTKPRLVGPVGERSQILKSPTGKMADITAAAVMDWISQTGKASAS